MTVRGEEIRLTPTEWHLLEVLVRHPGRLLSQRQLLTRSGGPATRPPRATCGSTWPSCAASSSRTRPARGTSGPSPAWATASSPEPNRGLTVSVFSPRFGALTATIPDADKWSPEIDLPGGVRRWLAAVALKGGTRARAARALSETRRPRRRCATHPHIGYLFHCPRTGPGEARSRRRARRSHFGCPRWSCGSHLACAGRASPGRGEAQEGFAAARSSVALPARQP